MTPDELDLIRTSSKALDADPDGFSAAFYKSVFEIAPGVRPLFPADLAEQRNKLVRELQFMVGAATASADAEQFEEFVARTRRLGQRHVGYGVEPAMYDVVGVALISTLRDAAEGFSDDHERAWSKLYGLISESMIEGATQVQSLSHQQST